MTRNAWRQHRSFILAVVTSIVTQPKVVIPTNSRTFGRPHRLAGTNKTADFTQTPRGHRTGCPAERRRGEFGIVLSSFGKGVRRVNDSSHPLAKA